jgi:hypothetical protein
VAASIAVAARGAEQAPAVEFRVEGSFPIQYVETVSRGTRRDNVLNSPFLELSVIGHLQPGLDASIFASGGHDPLGEFRDNDNTFLSAGANIVKRWGAFSAGVSFERTHFYDGTFEQAGNIANDFNVFARYRWTPTRISK